jgi:hypothetical protein
MSYFIGNTAAERNLANALIDELHNEFGLPLSDSSNGGEGFSYQPSGPHPDPLIKGNLGDAGSVRRAEWKVILQDANSTIQRAANVYSNTPEDFKQQIFPEFGIEYWDTSLNFATTDLAQFDSFTRANAERFFWSELEGPPTYTVRNLILIYQALMGDGSYDPFPDPPGSNRGFPLDGRLGRWTPVRVRNLLLVVNRELDLRQEAVSEAVATQEYILDSIGIDYEADDINFIMNNDDFTRFFSTTFDSDTISLIPLIYNFYLSSKYFQGINEAFRTPKDRVLSIILSTIANDNNFDSTPDLSRPAANNAIASSTGQDQNAAFNSAARDFILKMLIKTPIDILKGVVELADPHVAISKGIKIGTGFAFNELAKVIDESGVAQELNTALAEGSQGNLNPSFNGEDLTKLLLCLGDFAMQEGLAATLDASQPPNDDGQPPVPENFFPRVSIDGIDFTGTVSGMLMMPPSPLGIIYLLLELLKSDITNQTNNVSNASAENADANECSDTPEEG